MDYFEFGPFRLEVSSRALFRGDEFVPVTPKALDTLYVLVEDAGHVVSKEDLLQRVWPDAFVEEGSIANNISMLRKILNPYFDGDGPIATIPRRGYRFTAPVTLRSRVADIGVIADSGPLDEVSKKAIEKRVSAGGTDYNPSAGPHIFLGMAAALVVIGVGIGAMYYPRWLAPAVTTQAAAAPMRRSVAVLPMKNLSGDAAQNWLSTALAETISTELAGGNQFRVVSGENVVRMQQELAPPVGVGLTRKQLDDIGRDLACDLILTGNFLVVGGKMRVDVRLDEVATGEAIASASVTDTEDRFLDVVARAGVELRKTLGVNPQDSAATEAIRASFAASPEALRNYFEGLEAMRRRDGPRARGLLSLAIATEPKFALAHSALSSTWRILGYDARGAESAKRALDLSTHLSPEDRLSVEAQYHEATAAWPKAIELYQQLWQRYPDNVEYGLKLGNAQWLGGKPNDALTTVGELRKLPERDSRDSRIDLLEASAADSLSDYPRATAAAARAADKAIADKAKLLLARARIKQGIYAARLSRRDEGVKYFVEAESLFTELNDVGGIADAIRWQANSEFDVGRYDEAARLQERAYKLVAPLNYVRLMVELQIGQSDTARVTGNRARAIATGESALAAAKESAYRSGQARALSALGLAWRQQGDMDRARRSLEEAAAIASDIGESRTANAALNNSGVIDYLTGDLENARSKFERILADDRKSDSKAGIALRLSNISRILVLQNDIAGAEKMNVEECALQEQLKAKIGLAWCRTRLADIYIERGRKAEADALVKPIVPADFGRAVIAPIYIARYARVQLALGHLDAAAKAIDEAERVQASAGVVEEQAIHISTIRAEVEAAQGKKSAAIARLQRARSDADRRGLQTWSLDARRVLSRIEATKGT